MRVASSRRWPVWLSLAFFSLSASACSPRRLIINSMANALTSGTSSLGTEDDPELILDALPFALISLESLAESAPNHEGLRLTLASGFVQYAYAESDLSAELVKYENYERFRALQDTARKRYLRGKRWGMEGLELRHPGLEAALSRDPAEAVKVLTAEDVPLLYWTGAGWLGAISISVDRVALLAQLPQAAALLDRAAALEPDYEEGALHELLMALNMSRDVSQGGGEASALKHYERALELSKGQRASVYVGYASSIAVRKQDARKFEEQLDLALAIDPDQVPKNRLSNLLSRRKAEYLKAHLEDLFDLPVESEESTPGE